MSIPAAAVLGLDFMCSWLLFNTIDVQLVSSARYGI